MVRQAQRGFAVVGMAGLACIVSCAAQSVSTGSLASADVAKPAAIAPAFSVHTPIDKIAADEKGKAILNKDLPGMMSNPSYAMFSSMSLSQLATLSGGRLTKTKLNQVNSDLAELSPGQ